MYTDPPAALPAALITTVPADTSVWRITAPLAAPPTSTDAETARAHGGRFDSLDGSYGILRRRQPGGAVAETLCRNLPVDQSPS